MEAVGVLATGPSASVGPLAAGASTIVHLDYIFLKSGYFLSIVNVDTDRTIAETNEDNNLAIYVVQVEAANVDLIITNFYVTPVNGGSGPLPVAQGQNAYAYITVENTGNTDAGPFQVSWTPTFKAPALTANVAGGLAAGSSTTVELAFNYPDLGKFFTKAMVDSSRLIRETNEFNNTDYEQVEVVPALADLSATNITFSPASPLEGENVHVTVTVENNGFVSTGQNFVVSWQPKSTGSALSQVVAPLAAGASTDVAFDYTYTKAGMFDTTATADSTNVITELDENNNVFTAPITIGDAAADLTITNVAFVPASPNQGDSTTINVTIMNTGNADAGPFVVSFNPTSSGTTVPSSGTLTSQVDSLGAGASLVVPFTFTYTKAGAFHTVAQVDAFRSVRESNESNNQYLADITVNPDNINLTITGFSLSANPTDRFSKVTATITVQNTGSLPVGFFKVEWLGVSTNPSGPSKWLPGLNPGESVVFTLDNFYFNSGTFTTIVTVDPDNKIAETNEGDNSSSTSITINPISIP